MSNFIPQYLRTLIYDLGSAYSSHERAINHTRHIPGLADVDVLLNRGDLRRSIVTTAGARCLPQPQTMTTTLTVVEGQMLIGIAVPRDAASAFATPDVLPQWEDWQSNIKLWRWEFFFLPRNATL